MQECRDLHEHLPTNLHESMPPCGALADLSPSVGHVDPDTITVPLASTPPGNDESLDQR